MQRRGLARSSKYFQRSFQMSAPHFNVVARLLCAATLFRVCVCVCAVTCMRRRRSRNLIIYRRACKAETKAHRNSFSDTDAPRRIQSHEHRGIYIYIFIIYLDYIIFVVISYDFLSAIVSLRCRFSQLASRKSHDPIF